MIVWCLLLLLLLLRFGCAGDEALQREAARDDVKGSGRGQLGRAGGRRDHALVAAVAGDRRGEKHGLAMLAVWFARAQTREGGGKQVCQRDGIGDGSV